MQVSLTATEVRDIVLRILARHGGEVLDAADLEERIRISDGRRVAHVFRTEDYMAMWMIDVGLLQFYDILICIIFLIDFGLFSYLRAARH